MNHKILFPQVVFAKEIGNDTGNMLRQVKATIVVYRSLYEFKALKM